MALFHCAQPELCPPWKPTGTLSAHECSAYTTICIPGWLSDLPWGISGNDFWQTGAGAVYYEGARYEDRVVPQAVRDMAARDPGPERERARSRSGHRDRSAERRNRRRDGESERERHRRKRDRHRRETEGRDDEGLAELTAPTGAQPSMGNALGIHPGSQYPGQGPYAPIAPPPVASTTGGVHHGDPYTSTSRVGGAPPTGHGIAPAIVTTVSVSGSRHRDVPLSAGPEPSRAARTGDPNTRWADPLSRPSSTPTGPLLSSWVAPDLSNPSLNSLGLSAPPQNVGGSNLRAFPAVPPRLTARDSVSSWGTEDSGPTQGDLFSTLRPLAPAPADGGPPPSDLLPRPEGQLLGVVGFRILSSSLTRAHVSSTGSLEPNREPTTPACVDAAARRSPGRPRRRRPPALPSLVAPFALSHYLGFAGIGHLYSRGATTVLWV